MKLNLKFHFLSILLCVLYFSAYSQTYYVDFENGNDVNGGLTEQTAWKHCPGDENATSSPKNITLNPGDTILFKGGVAYRGAITLKFGGDSLLPIIYKGDAWGTEKAIVTGTEILDITWSACQSADEANGNPNWQNIYYATFQGEISPFTHFFQDGEKLYPAQSPNISDPFWEDKINEYYPVPIGKITRTSIQDETVLIHPNIDHFRTAYVLIWVVPNVIDIRKINSFDTATNTIQFDSLASNAIYGNRDQYFSIVNNFDGLDRQGEFVIDEDNKKIFLWPYSPINNSELTYSTRAEGFCTNNKSNIIIEGFDISGMYSNDVAHGVWNNRYWDEPSKNLTIRNNDFSWIRCKNGKKGAIELSNIEGVLIENNTIRNIQRNCGMLLSSKNIIIKNNFIQKNGYKGLWFMGVENAQVLNNTFIECTGTHGNPVSIFTSKNCLFADNHMTGNGELLTYNANENFVVHNNLLVAGFDGVTETGTSIVRENGDIGIGYHLFTNNTILYSSTNFGFGISAHPIDPLKQIICNNIVDGGDNFLTNQISNNIYTGESWKMKNESWHLSEGEFYAFNLDTIFTNPGDNNFTLFSESLARNKGKDLTTVIPLEIKNLFPDYNFNLDILGNSRRSDGSWDIGAFEYQDSTIHEKLNLANQTFSGIDEMCFGATDTITVAGDGTFVTFESGSIINLIAGKSIRFLPGFHAQEGNTTYARITSSGEFCFPSGASVVSNSPINKSEFIVNEEYASKNNTIEKQLKVFPNPNNGRFTIKVEGLDQASQLVIYNLLGAIVHQDIIHYQQSIDISDKQPGLYLVKISNSKKALIQKILIK
jgi:hypothetical protein